MRDRKHRRPKNVADHFKAADEDPLAPEKPLDYYFSSYSNTSIHFDMLRDRARTVSYARAIDLARHLFAGKTVLDLGCGTGILSMFSAKAGAARVVAVEMASIYRQAQTIIEKNGLSSTIEVMVGRAEELPLPKVDIIVSEWMGYLLLYESMFDAVISARDRLLASGGKLFPNRARLFLAGCTDQTDPSRLENYLGVNLSKLGDHANIVPRVEHFDDDRIITHPATLAEFDLETCSADDLDFSTDFELLVTKQCFLNGLVAWFDVEFTHGREPVVLSTSPKAEPTHWKQSCFGLDARVPVFAGDRVRGRFWLRRNKENFRFLDIKVDLKLKNALGSHRHIQFFLFQ